MKILVLEDDQNRIKRFSQELIGNSLDICERAEEAIKLLKEKDYDVVFLDHDLGGQIYVDPLESNTGYEVIRFLARNITNTKANFIVHSMNSVGDSMVKSLKAKNYKAVRAVFNSPEFMSVIKQICDYKE